MTSDPPLKFSQVEERLALARAERPGLEKLRELFERVAKGTEKVEAAKAAGVNGTQLRAAERKLDELRETLSEQALAEQRWYVLDVVHAMMRDLHSLPLVPPGARLALILPGVIEFKVLLDGTDDIPF